MIYNTYIINSSFLVTLFNIYCIHSDKTKEKFKFLILEFVLYCTLDE